MSRYDGVYVHPEDNPVAHAKWLLSLMRAPVYENPSDSSKSSSDSGSDSDYCSGSESLESIRMRDLDLVIPKLNEKSESEPKSEPKSEPDLDKSESTRRSQLDTALEKINKKYGQTVFSR